MKTQGFAVEVQSQGVAAGLLQSVASLLPHIRDQGVAVEAQLGTDLLLGELVEALVAVEAGVLIPMIIQGMVPHTSRICWKEMVSCMIVNISLLSGCSASL